MINRSMFGFVLPLVLSILAILSVLINYLAERYDLKLEQVTHSQQAVATELKLFNAKNEMIYRLLTSPKSRDGIGMQGDKVLLDDSIYQNKSGVLVQLQDIRGLINLNKIDHDVLSRLLKIHGIDNISQQDQLYDVLEDYKDADHYKRVNGAEKSDYQQLGLRRPRNSPLLTPQELFELISWRDQAGLLRRSQFEADVSVLSSVGFNPNTASSHSLQALLAIDESTANKLLEIRKSGIVFSADTFLILLGREPMSMGYGITHFPGDDVRLTLSSPENNWQERILLSLTPTADSKPWNELYRYRIQNQPLTSTASSSAFIPLPEQKYEGPLQANVTPVQF